MATKLKALEFYRGDTFTFEITLQDVDITGATVFFTVKTETDDVLDDSSAVAKVTNVAGSHSDPTNGKTIVELTPAETQIIAPGEYVYDIQYKADTGEVVTIGVGECEVLAEVTRRSS